MSTTTSNFNLVKPELSDSADITATNPNWDKIDDELVLANHTRVYDAISTDGINYAITDDTIPTPYDGMTITLKPNMTSTTTSVYLSVNGVANHIVLYPKGEQLIGGVHPSGNTWLDSRTTITVVYRYSATYNNGENMAWFILGRQKLASTDSSGLMSSTDKSKLDNIPSQVLPLDGSTPMTGSLKIKGRAEIDGSDSLTYLKASKDINNFRYLRIINPLLTDYTIQKAIQWGNVVNSSEKTYDLYGSHNKPASSYTGNGSAASRTVAVGGIGEVLTITSDIGMALVTNRGAICLDRQTGTVSGLKSYEINYQNEVLTIATTSNFVNKNSVSYWYQVL